MKRYFLWTILSLTLAIRLSAQTADTFRKWGDDLLEQINKEFKLNREAVLYTEFTEKNEAAYAWSTGIILKALIYAGQLDEAHKLFTEFHNRYYYSGNGYSAYNATYGGKGDRYYDDNAWIAKDLLDLYDRTESETRRMQYLERAKIINRFCMSGERPGGGIRFHENFSDPNHAEYNNWAICATAPVACVNLRLYRITKDRQYLTDAKRLYHFMKDDGWGIGPGYRAYENAVVMQAALLLYQLTEEKEYLKDTYQLAYSIESRYASWQNKQLHETACWGGHDVTDAYVALYEEDKDPRWLNIVCGYLSFLNEYCKDGNGFYPEMWNNRSGDARRTDEDGSKRYYLLDQASAASAFFRMSHTIGGEVAVLEPVAIFENGNYNRNGLDSGWSIGLNIGDYTRDSLAFLGLTNNRFQFAKDISSLRVNAGYKIILYDEDHFSGNSREYSSNTSALRDWNDRAVSLKVVSLHSGSDQAFFEDLTIGYPAVDNPTLSISGLRDEATIRLFDSSGKLLYSGKNSGSDCFIDMGNFSKGFYFLRIDSKEKQKSVKFKK